MSLFFYWAEQNVPESFDAEDRFNLTEALVYKYFDAEEVVSNRSRLDTFLQTLRFCRAEYEWNTPDDILSSSRINKSCINIVRNAKPTVKKFERKVAWICDMDKELDEAIMDSVSRPLSQFEIQDAVLKGFCFALFVIAVAGVRVCLPA